MSKRVMSGKANYHHLAPGQHISVKTLYHQRAAGDSVHSNYLGNQTQDLLQR